MTATTPGIACAARITSPLVSGWPSVRASTDSEADTDLVTPSSTALTSYAGSTTTLMLTCTGTTSAACTCSGRRESPAPRRTLRRSLVAWSSRVWPPEPATVRCTKRCRPSHNQVAWAWEIPGTDRARSSTSRSDTTRPSVRAVRGALARTSDEDSMSAARPVGRGFVTERRPSGRVIGRVSTSASSRPASPVPIRKRAVTLLVPVGSRDPVRPSPKQTVIVASSSIRVA